MNVFELTAMSKSIKTRRINRDRWAGAVEQGGQTFERQEDSSEDALTRFLDGSIHFDLSNGCALTRALPGSIQFLSAASRRGSSMNKTLVHFIPAQKKDEQGRFEKRMCDNALN
jgi:hypothetical protein